MKTKKQKTEKTNSSKYCYYTIDRVKYLTPSDKMDLHTIIMENKDTIVTVRCNNEIVIIDTKSVEGK